MTPRHTGAGSKPSHRSSAARLLLCGAAVVAVLGAASQFAAHAENELAPGVTYEAFSNFEIASEQNFDLNHATADEVLTHETELGLELSFDPGRWIRGFAQFELSRIDFIKNQANKRDKGWEFEVQQAYFDIVEIFDHFTLRLGRQEFADPMEWLYDEELDAIRLFFENGPVSFELSISRLQLLDRDILNFDKSDVTNNYVAMGHYALGKKSRATAYVFYRDEMRFKARTPEDLLFFGVQSIGELTSSLDYWLNAAYVTGDRGGREIQAFGFDIGATQVFEAFLEPSITLGVAFGTGDRNRNSGKNTNFRQTGLEDNNARFNGVTSFKYLGELVDPEISNIVILTAGAGIRPTDQSSIDVIYHYYQQDKAANRQNGTSLTLRPNGIDKSLGHEIDLDAGYRMTDNVRLELVLGAFFPGSAFGPSADNAYFGTFEVKITY